MQDVKTRIERWAPLALFVLACVVFSVYALAPEFIGHGKTKDYPLWFAVGQRAVHRTELYLPGADGTYDFLYPPFAASLLAPMSVFGRPQMFVMLVLGNVLSWFLAVRLSERLTGDEPVSWWTRVVPSVFCLAFIFDMFDLGQPNLLLLVLMLAGLWMMSNGRPRLAGGAFAAAAAIKAFPIAIFPYLIWRRRWWTAGLMLVFGVFFVFIFPAANLGWADNVRELKLWSQGMVASADAKGFGQRPDQNWSWKNQSLIAVTHRLTRPLNAEAGDPKRPPLTVNFLNLSYQAANKVVLGVAAVLGLAFVVAMPRWKRRTPQSDAAEWAILVCLITIASPLAREYYFVWLLFPLTVLVRAAVRDPDAKARRIIWGSIAAAFFLFALGIPTALPRLPAALGVDLWATLVLVGALAWQMQRSALAPGHGEGQATAAVDGVGESAVPTSA